ncbi:MAG: DNA alkylation repair protein [Terrimicrobiaceae bacterium]
MAEASDFKEIYNVDCLKGIASQVAASFPRFDQEKFLQLAMVEWEELNLMARIQRISESLRATLPARYPAALGILRKVAECSEPGFYTLYLPDFVGRYGLEDFDLSMEALREFTPLSSSEYGVRPFLAADLSRALRILSSWTEHPDAHVRRLSSEGSRPRLPWAPRLEALVRDPRPTIPILEALKADGSPYVRKSVANHINDITKDHPDLALELLGSWDSGCPAQAWITRHALRTLIKAGDQRALGMIGAGKPARGKLRRFQVTPRNVRLGDEVTFEMEFHVMASARLVIDYAVHYVRLSGGLCRKVFKWKVVDAEAGDDLRLKKRQRIKDFSTRRHYAGRHRVELLINGKTLGETGFVINQDQAD